MKNYKSFTTVNFKCNSCKQQKESKSMFPNTCDNCKSKNNE